MKYYMIRGGSFYFGAIACEISYRYNTRIISNYNVGFRLIKTIKQ